MKNNESMICLGLSFFLILFVVNNFFSLEGLDDAAMMNSMEGEDIIVSNDELDKEKLQEQVDVNKNNNSKVAAKVRSLIDKYDEHIHSYPMGETDATLKTEGETGISAAEMEEYIE